MASGRESDSMATTPRGYIWEHITYINPEADKAGMTVQFADGNGRMYYPKEKIVYSRTLSITQGHWQDSIVGAEEQLLQDEVKDFAAVMPVVGREYRISVTSTVSGDAVTVTKLVDDVQDVVSVVN